MTQTTRKNSPEMRDLAEAKCREATALEEAGKFRDALNLLTDTAPLFESVKDELLRGRFNMNLGKAFEQVDYEDQEGCLRRALEAYNAARSYFNCAGQLRSVADVESKLGRLYLRLNNLSKARVHLKRARRFYEGRGDRVAVAQVDTTRAQLYLAEGKYVIAARLAGDVVASMKRLGNRPKELARALITRARALARKGNYEWAIAALQQAHETALKAGERECAGDASLTLIEELNSSMTASEMAECYLEANDLLRSLKDIPTLKRFSVCARIVAERSKTEMDNPDLALGIITSKKPISLADAVNRYEGALVKRAMELSDYKVLRAARLLGLKSHQTLLAMLNKRHSGLMPEGKRRTRTTSA